MHAFDLSHVRVFDCDFEQILFTQVEVQFVYCSYFIFKYVCMYVVLISKYPPAQFPV